MNDLALLDSRAANMVMLGPGGCWCWVGALDRHGYGKITRTFEGCRYWLAHRYVFRLLGNIIPEGLQLDHLCRNRSCVNPAHLEPVTPRVNSRRGMRAMQTLCIHGHPFDAANTDVTSQGIRRCRTCHASRSRASRLRTNGGTYATSAA